MLLFSTHFYEKTHGKSQGPWLGAKCGFVAENMCILWFEESDWGSYAINILDGDVKYTKAHHSPDICQIYFHGLVKDVAGHGPRARYAGLSFGQWANEKIVYWQDALIIGRQQNILRQSLE